MTILRLTNYFLLQYYLNMHNYNLCNLLKKMCFNDNAVYRVLVCEIKLLGA